VSERNSLHSSDHQSLLCINSNTCLFTAYACLCSFVQHVRHRSLLRFYFSTPYSTSSPSYAIIRSSLSHYLSSIPPINSVCTVAIHLAPPSSLPRAVVGYSPASFFALSPLLIDRSRRKTLHTLQLTYTSRLRRSTRPRLV